MADVVPARAALRRRIARLLRRLANRISPPEPLTPKMTVFLDGEPVYWLVRKRDDEDGR